jgi:hypothetical protein
MLLPSTYTRIGRRRGVISLLLAKTEQELRLSIENAPAAIRTWWSDVKKTKALFSSLVWAFQIANRHCGYQIASCNWKSKPKINAPEYGNVYCLL